MKNPDFHLRSMSGIRFMARHHIPLPAVDGRAERRRFEYLVKGYPRRRNLTKWAARAAAAGAFIEICPGKQVDLKVAWNLG
jgi:hypothetical protein